MAIVPCKECGRDVSTTAAACPGCGAPFKAFMGPPKGFKDRFSVERLDAAQAEARASHDRAGRSLFRSVVGWGVLILIFLVAVRLF